MVGMQLRGVGGMLETFDDIQDTMSVRGGWSISTNISYSVHQEWGTTYQSGTPHVRPGFDAVVSSFDTQFMDVDDVEAELARTAFLIESKIKSFAPVDTGTLRASYTTVRY